MSCTHESKEIEYVISYSRYQVTRDRTYDIVQDVPRVMMHDPQRKCARRTLYHVSDDISPSMQPRNSQAHACIYIYRHIDTHARAHHIQERHIRPPLPPRRLTVTQPLSPDYTHRRSAWKASQVVARARYIPYMAKRVWRLTIARMISGA